MDIRGLLHAIATCVTAGPGLGFNRVAVFLADEDDTVLAACMAIGPSTWEEAHGTWAQLASEHTSLDELLSRPPSDGPRSAFETAVEGLVIPLTDARGGSGRRDSARENPLLDAYRNRRVVKVADAASLDSLPQAVREVFGGSEVVCVPLVAKARSIGLIVADNAFTREPIGEERIQPLKLLALLSGLAVDNARIYGEIERQAARLRETLGELRDTQQELVRRERLAAVGAVVARVSHEIRNPLSTIGGFASRLSAAPEDPVRVRRNAGIIAVEVEKLEELLREMLDFTTMRVPVRAPTSVNGLVAGLADLHRGELLDRGIELTLDLAADVPETGLDANQIQRVLLNLWRNAVESMEDESHPCAKALRITTARDRDRIRIVVADSGVGMPVEVASRIFTPFYTTKRHGSGLGLAVVKKIIEDHQGQIDVDTAPGGGTTFTVTLPITR